MNKKRGGPERRKKKNRPDEKFSHELPLFLRLSIMRAEKTAPQAAPKVERCGLLTAAIDCLKFSASGQNRPVRRFDALNIEETQPL
ncbi:MAG TPA: hypothetical protein VKA60_04560 [Blastocatellia bacterium]|nr:hypothetical protein [Blastocatellia bacterium]